MCKNSEILSKLVFILLPICVQVRTTVKMIRECSVLDLVTSEMAQIWSIDKNDKNMIHVNWPEVRIEMKKNLIVFFQIGLL